MVAQTHRRVLLKSLHRFIEHNQYMLYFKMTRRSYLNLCRMVETLEDNRYLDRSFCGPTVYVAVSETRILEMVTPYDYREFRECFRMSRDELRTLYAQVGDHPIWNTGRGRRQRHPMIQLSVFLYRLGSGNRLTDVARTLGRISIGSVVKYTERSLVAINSIYRREVAWPSAERREEMALWHRCNHKLPGCVGYIDGSHVLLRKCPSFDDLKNASFFTRKKRYALLILAACDEAKRFTYLQVGHYGSAHDSRAQKSTGIHRNAEDLFDNDQYLLADSGFVTTSRVVAMYKRKARGKLSRIERAFNKIAAIARVRIEHAFGVLKQRFRMLSDMNITLKIDDDLALARLFIRAAVILHNMFIQSSIEYWDEQAFNDAKNDAENDDALQRDLADHASNFDFQVDPTSSSQPERRQALANRVLDLAERENFMLDDLNSG